MGFNCKEKKHKKIIKKIKTVEMEEKIYLSRVEINLKIFRIKLTCWRNYERMKLNIVMLTDIISNRKV
jgi:hypothetical protein